MVLLDLLFPFRHKKRTITQGLQSRLRAEARSEIMSFLIYPNDIYDT